MPNKLAALAAGVILIVSSCTKPDPMPDPGNLFPSAGDVSVAVSVDASTPGLQIPANFLGLSFEKSTLVNSTWYGPSNFALNNMVKGLGSQGILRVGGNSTEQVQWIGIVPPGSTNYISGVEAQAFLHFAEATGWPMMWSVASDPYEDGWVQAEINWLAETYYSRDFMTAFEIGNEPDLYSVNGLRPSTYTYERFKSDWASTRQEIVDHYTNSTPYFAGPETSSNGWVGAFVRDRHSLISILTEHYFKMGMGADSTESIEKLLDGNDEVLSRVAVLKAAAAPYNLPVRITECNSTASNKEGVSNTFASALWSIDFMFALAQQGVAGVNFHSGKAPSTPISFVGGPAKPMPLYYGLLFFANASHGKLLTVKTQPESAINLVAYAVQEASGKMEVTLINKDLSKEAYVTLSATGGNSADISYAWATRLTAPSVSSATGVKYNGKAVESDGTWDSYGERETLVVTTSEATKIKVPAHSAVMVTLSRTPQNTSNVIAK